MADTVTPDFTGVVNQQVFLAPLGGPQHPQNYLDRFPEEVYSKGIDSHLVKFMYALLGPAGVGWLRKNYLESRLKLEDYGIETFDLDRFYGNPLAFSRILEEVYDNDPGGLIPRDEWEKIRAKDARYRNRALDYVQGVRAGNTPFGMRLIARSGLGHEVEVVENYRYWYDQLSDDPLGIVNYGHTTSTGEMVILPRRELPQNEVQILRMQGVVTGGTFTLVFPMGNVVTNTTAPIAYNATRATIQAFLEGMQSIGSGNVRVTGGPLPATPIEVHFINRLSFKDVPQLQVGTNSITGTGLVTMTIETERGGTGQTDEIVNISDRDKYHLKEALSRTKPVATIVSFAPASGNRSHQPHSASYGASVYNEVVRYVTGAQQVTWPAVGGENWIEQGVEKEAPRSLNDLKQHYQGFHNIANVVSYTETALTDADYAVDVTQLAVYKNELIGEFSQFQRALFPILRAPEGTQGLYQFTADKASADYPEPLTINNSITSDDSIVSLINGIYPATYQNLPGVPPVRYKESQFYASMERTEGADYLEIDLDDVRAVNYIYLEITRKPFDVEVSYDVLDLAPARSWQGVTYDTLLSAPVSIGYEAKASNPWLVAHYNFTNSLGNMIYTRYLRLKFTRRLGPDSPFQTPEGDLFPYSVEIRNLRVGRNTA